jgi:hypothetical protein
MPPFLVRTASLDRSRNSNVKCFTSQEEVMQRPDPARGMDRADVATKCVYQ